MIEIVDMEEKTFTDDSGAAVNIVTISCEANPVAIFQQLTEQSVLSAKDLYELGSYLRTFADFKMPCNEEGMVCHTVKF